MFIEIISRLPNCETGEGGGDDTELLEQLGTLYGQSQTEIVGFQAVPGPHGIFVHPWGEH